MAFNNKSAFADTLVSIGLSRLQAAEKIARPVTKRQKAPGKS
jgi:hypothetical protein